MKLTEPQSELFLSDSKATAFVSGFGAGKTNAAISLMLQRKFEYPEVDIMYGAPTYPLIRDILYPEITVELEKQGFEEGIDFKINEQKHYIEFQGSGKIICKTLDRPERIVGFQAGDAFLDEFDILQPDKAKQAWRKTLARIRKPFNDGKQNQIYVTTTPEGFRETYRLFVKEKKPNYRLIKASTYSNPYLPDDYISTLIDEYPDALVAAYINGEFVNLTSGTVYYAFDRKICDCDVQPKEHEALHVGMDFNVYKMAAIVHVQRGGKLYAVNELIGYRDTDSIADALREVFPKNPIYIYPDASGKAVSSKSASLSDLKILKDRFFKIRALSKNPFIKDRVNSMNAAFEKGNYFVNTKECPIYTECLEQQVYDNLGKPDKSNDLDHPTDAGGYCCNYLYPVNKRRIIERKLGGF